MLYCLKGGKEMFLYKSTKQQLLEERKKRKAAEKKLNQTSADLDYVAMMCDIELETEENTDEQI